MSLLDNDKELFENTERDLMNNYFKPINKIIGGVCSPNMIALNEYNRFLVFDKEGYWREDSELSKECLLILINADAKINDLLPENLDNFITNHKTDVIKAINEHNHKLSLIGHIDINCGLNGWASQNIASNKTHSFYKNDTGGSISKIGAITT